MISARLSLLAIVFGSLERRPAPKHAPGAGHHFAAEVEDGENMP